LSLEPTDNPTVTGDGSFEASGTLYIDNIREYNNTSQGLLLNDVLVHSGNFGSVLIPFITPSSGFTSGSLITNGGITIRNTSNASDVSSGNALTVFGGASIVKDVIIGGNLDMTGGTIANVSWPTTDYDGVPKIYVDTLVSSGGGGASGNFSTGQVIVAETIGSALIGYPNFTFLSNVLTLGSGATLRIETPSSDSIVSLGGAQLGGLLDMGDNRIVSLDPPIFAKDAVNKEFLETSINNLVNYTTGQVIVGGNDGTTSTLNGYPEMIYNTSGLFITSDANLSLTTISNILNMSDNRIVELADPIEPQDAVNKRYFLEYMQVCDPNDEFEDSEILAYSQTYLPTLLVYSTDLIAFDSFAYARSINGDENALYNLKGLYDTDTSTWTLSVVQYGNIPGLQFIMNGNTIQYKNTLSDVYIKYRTNTLVSTIDTEYQEVVISANVLPTSTGIYFTDYYNETDIHVRTNGYSLHRVKVLADWTISTMYFGQPGVQFSVSAFGELMYTSTHPGVIKYSLGPTSLKSVPVAALEPLVVGTDAFIVLDPNLFTTGFLLIYTESPGTRSGYKIIFQYSDTWSINTSFIGDATLGFYMDGNTLMYTNSTPDLSTVYTLDTPGVHGLCVVKGGTGRNEIPPGQILVGNGQGAIQGFSEFMFYNNTLTVHGVPVAQHIPNFSAQNNQGVPQDIPQALFTGKSIVLSITVTVTTNVEYNTMFTIKYIKAATNILDVSQIGDVSGIDFNIIGGQLSYTSPNMANWVSTIMRFSVLGVTI
jgi:hypothetical protein